MWLFGILFLWRLLNSLISRTYFQADEFWQTLEPAHWKAFGYGTITWEWKEGFRSYAFPFLFEIVYRSIFLWKSLYKFIGLNMDYWNTIEYKAVLYLPKILMALIAAIGEYYMCLFITNFLCHINHEKKSLAKDQTYKEKVTKTVLILTMTNFFNGFFITRTFINSFEMTLTSISLYYWKWNNISLEQFSFQMSLFLALFTCLQRPSNGIIWIILGCSLLYNLLRDKQYSIVMKLLYYVIRNFIIVLIFNCIIDYHFYHKLIFPIFKFIEFNFTTPLSQFYGVAPWHFHILQSCPILLGYNIPFFIIGFFVSINCQKKSSFYKLSPHLTMKLALIVNLIIYSCLPHKEFRFVFQIQPFFLLYATLGVLRTINYIPRWIIYSVPLISTIGFIIVDYCHEAGSIEVIKYLHNLDEIESLGFVMPCHSTPGHSYLHRDDIKDLWSISCEPPLTLLNATDASIRLSKYMDESDHFYNDIPKFFNKYFSDTKNNNNLIKSKEFDRIWPQYLVVFEHLNREFLSLYFQENGMYKEHKRFFNTLSHWDSRRSGDIVIYKKVDIL